MVDIPKKLSDDLASQLLKSLRNGERIDTTLVGELIKELNNRIGLQIAEIPEYTLSPERREQLLDILKDRFLKNKNLHKGIKWIDVIARLNEASPEKLWALNEMERTGGEPDVIGFIEETGEYEFWDCSPESPSGRRSLAYDKRAQETFKRWHDRPYWTPKGNAVDFAKEMRIGGILNENQYRKLQWLGKFDSLGTISWIDTPKEIRVQGYALSGSRHDNKISVHKGVKSEVSQGLHFRGFRGWLRI